LLQTCASGTFEFQQPLFVPTFTPRFTASSTASHLNSNSITSLDGAEIEQIVNISAQAALNTANPHLNDGFLPFQRAGAFGNQSQETMETARTLSKRYASDEWTVSERRKRYTHD
jgi:hypothetical protein